MPIGLIFWVLMLLWIISVIGRRWGGSNMPWAEPAGDFIILVLFFLLGWRVFGFIVHA
jgi:TRAP-type C4-dicarboxylate transport system permease small subunit